MTDNINLQPIIAPLVALLKSRKVIVSLCALLLNFVVTAVPTIATYRGELMAVITGLALALIGGIAYEDAARTGREAGSAGTMSNADLIKLLLSDLIDSISTDLNGQTVITLKQ